MALLISAGAIASVGMSVRPAVISVAREVVGAHCDMDIDRAHSDIKSRYVTREAQEELRGDIKSLKAWLQVELRAIRGELAQRGGAR